MSSQFDLFDDTQTEPPTSVARLPAAHWGPAIWRPRVRRVAEILERGPSEKARTAYWARTCLAVAKQLGKHGATPTEIDRQIDAFFVAVDKAMHEMREVQHG